MQNHLLNRIAVSMIPGSGSVLTRKLLTVTGSPEALLEESAKNLSKIPQIPRLVIDNIKSKKFFAKAEAEFRFVEDNKLEVLFFQDEAFPQRLNECYDAPVLLYFKGRTNLNKQKIVSVVGTRRCSKYGQNITEKILDELAMSNQEILIISGLAYGIDIATHKAIVKTSMDSVTVLAHGLDDLYPAGHRDTADKMLHNGGLLSEYTQSTIPDAANFVKRNRIVAGMSDVTLVVESGVKGGAMITANLAFSYDREVVAVPGNAGNYYSAGCNFLIKSNKATLVESADDIIKLMNWDINKQPVQRKMFLELNPNEEAIYKLLEKQEQVSLNEIGLTTGMPINTVSLSLLNMEMQGIIKTLPGNMFCLS